LKAVSYGLTSIETSLQNKVNFTKSLNQTTMFNLCQTYDVLDREIMEIIKLSRGMYQNWKNTN
jgi:hypothetical protein